VSKPLVILLTVGVLAAFTALRAVDLVWWRAQTLAAADARAANLSFILSEYLREIFAEGDASLRQVSQYSRRIGGPTSLTEGDAITIGPVTLQLRVVRALGSTHSTVSKAPAP